jgi:DNA-binding NarL/FixJ family response regulator
MTQADHVKQSWLFRGVYGEALLRQVKVPTLFVASRSGTRPSAGEADSAMGAAIVPGAQLMIVEGRNARKLEADGSVPMPVRATEIFLNALRERQQEAWTAPPPTLRELTGPYPDNLTSREVQVLRLIATGLSNQQIAESLVVSTRTVERHAANIYAKTGTHSRVQASVYAVRHGLA